MVSAGQQVVVYLQALREGESPPVAFIDKAYENYNELHATQNNQNIAAGGDGGNAFSGSVTTVGDIAPSAAATAGDTIINNNMPSAADTVNATFDGAERFFKLGQESVESAAHTPIPTPIPGNDPVRNQQMADAKIWVEWQRKRGEGVTKTEFSLEKGMTKSELEDALDRHRNGRYGIVQAVPSPIPIPANNEVVPPDGGMTTRGIIARKLNRTPGTLRGWEKAGVAPGGIPWPKGQREGTTVLYRVADVWPSLLKMMSDRDKAKYQQLLWEIM